MKFLCEQCKAKYQISDDKVAGKTVRMKCRKCGHMIEVRAEVTETSVSRGMPKELQARAAAEGSAAGSGAHAASTSAASAGGSGAPVRTPPPSPSRPAGSPRPPAAGENHGTNSKGTGLATSLSARKPLAPRSLITPPPTPAQNVGEATVVAPPPNVGPGSGALAGAFQKSIVKDDPALRDITGLKEWYVAINGVPVGPVRIAELRRKASLGAVTEDSLVWQEGMEEWRPVKAYSELLALVREAAQSGRPPLAVTGDVRQSTPPPPGKGAYVPRGAVALNRPPAGPGGDTFRPARSNVLPFAPRNAAAEKLEDPEATEVATQALQQPSQTIQTPVPPEVVDPFAAPMVGGPKAQEDPFRAGPPAGTSRPPLSVQISPASGSVISPFAAGASSPGPAPNFASNVNTGDRSSVSLGPPILATEPPPQKKGVPWIPLAMVALAGAFGITAAIVIFRQPAQAPAAPPPVAAASSTPPVASTPPPAASAEIELPAESPAASASADKGTSTGPKVAAGTPKPAASASSNGTKTADLSDLLKGSGSGPSSGSGNSGSASGGGGSLTEDQIRAVLNQHSLGVRRNCWERGSTGQVSSVNVGVRIVVNGQGQVTSANADGNDPAIAKCIETSVRSWTFPATGGTSTVNIPFKFVRQ
ncbi:zinc-ribbon domain-containing protein [Pendulispora rubella]|uniref:Zinc-ribbon domain-containing protein n=1 Tax=Pendulispora rubella TaxID=2741070 RepID=A0ABZ2LE89_9BACT